MDHIEWGVFEAVLEPETTFSKYLKIEQIKKPGTNEFLGYLAELAGIFKKPFQELRKEETETLVGPVKTKEYTNSKEITK